MISRIQRIENLALAALIAVLFVGAGYDWWWLLALFLVFDLSMLGYAKSPALGALGYNAVHNYTVPALLAAAYALTGFFAEPIWILGLLAGTWGFHVAADRALGYGLKLSEGFEHTHLGRIGQSRSDHR